MNRKAGFEIELIAPRGLSRRDLALAIAKGAGGSVEPCFYPQAEPSLVPGRKVFETLTLAFAVRDNAGHPLCTIADDMTLQDDFEKTAPPKEGWYRIAGDDLRLMRLIARHADPAAELADVLTPLAALFGGTVSAKAGRLFRLDDSAGASIAIAGAQPGERERAAEIISAPIEDTHEILLERLLAPARDLEFQLPAEGAVHVHFDAAKLLSARRMQAMIRLFAARREELLAICKPNQRCRRLGPWPPALLETVNAPDFASLPWPEAVERLEAANPVKFCDFNITNILAGRPDKLTFEVRILPPSLSAAEIMSHARHFAGLLDEAEAA